jgi:hypothetical protein
MRGLTIASVVAAALASLAVAAGPATGDGGALSVTFLPSTHAPVGAAAVIPIRIANGRPEVATGVVLRVSAPSWVTLSGARCDRRRAQLNCRLPDLASGSRVTVTIKAKASRNRSYRVSARATVTVAPEPAAAERRLAGAAPPFAAR